MAEPTQSFENHAKIPTGLIVEILLLLVAAILGTAGLVVSGGEASTGFVLLALGFILSTLTAVYLASHLRTTALTLQDRIVRLEMNVRLDRLLDSDLRRRARTLTLKQLIALRFASDEELPGLVKKVLDEKIVELAAIKKLVRDWQPDFQRI